MGKIITAKKRRVISLFPSNQGAGERVDDVISWNNGLPPPPPSRFSPINNKRVAGTSSFPISFEQGGGGVRAQPILAHIGLGATGACVLYKRLAKNGLCNRDETALYSADI